MQAQWCSQCNDARVSCEHMVFPKPFSETMLFGSACDDLDCETCQGDKEAATTPTDGSVA